MTASTEATRSWTVRELADELGVTTRTLRFYEAEGLLRPERVGTNRVYSQGDRARLRLILRGRRFGMSVAECREIVSMYDGAASSERRQLEVLLGRLAALRQKQGGVVALIGEAGLGKSRLIAELRKARDAEPDNPAEWFETRAISYGQSIPYYPWRQLGRQIVGGSEGDTAEGMRTRLHDVVARLGVDAVNVPFLETMLAIDTEESRAALMAAGFRPA